MPRFIFLAFANSDQTPLPSLLEESDSLYDILSADSLQNDYRLIREDQATPKIINKRFVEAGNDIVIFHYSGHAGPNALLLDDRNINAQGIAFNLHKSAQNGVLKLVILNGCSTKQQVQLLLELGVPAVIATHAPVNDNSACEFAKQLFKNLIQGSMDIESAFNNSLVAAQNATDRLLNIGNKEPRGLKYLEEVTQNDQLWELFHQNSKDININPLPRKTVKEEVKFEINRPLRDALYTALDLKNNRQLLALDVIQDQDKDNVIVRSLPMPIGEHIRILFTQDSDDDGPQRGDINRLKQLCRLYYITMEFLSYVLIAQLWEYRSQKTEEDEVNTGDRHLPAPLLNILTTHFQLSLEKRTEFDYLNFFKSLFSFFDSRPNLSYFIDELRMFGNLLAPETDFSNACTNLVRLCVRIQKIIPDAEVPGLCRDGEVWVSKIFSKLGFLRLYHLTSIQAISIFKYRHIAEPSYNHSVIQLMRVNNSEKFLYKLNDCLACQGVVLLKGALRRNDQGVFTAVGDLKFLNLSPFLIDISAFEGGNKVRIGVFGEYNETDNEYRFKDISKPDSTRDLTFVNAGSVYMSVKVEMDYYRTEILGSTLTSRL